ncbi:hypothetical protein SAMN04487895_101765 [Paenibacillus sophorae]|uniref:Carboxypeptidase regulatory-like domain-containing protein n=1 Tax=Paenibacillus sophorae TaxID=1333845 RepID=A0A1H8H7V9_9BACL|nr:hypothetical protein [Paenibacillus sophorae]QWU14453.1 hypothetical protein KP014_21330 [Paenibacillus sophorae]SEN51608.1 hypothetical protein SAMN04487895_101765 [Paenibacillus sophorae]
MKKLSFIVLSVLILILSVPSLSSAATKSSSPKSTTKPKPTIVASGKLKGTITWQYNDYVGTKPDVGAEIYLIPVKLKKNSLAISDFVKVADKKITAKSVGIYYTVANGYGNFEINNIPVGDYVIYVVSMKTLRDVLTPYNDETANKLLKPYIKNWNDFLKGSIQASKSVIDTMTVEKNQTIDFSFDFGNTVY